MYCSKCGKSIGANSPFCEQCGHSADPFRKWRSKYPFWVQLLIANCLALPLILAGYYNFTQALPNVAGAELEALHSKEYSKAFYAYTHFQGKSDLIDFREFLKKHPLLLHYQSYQIDSLDSKKNRLVVKLISGDKEQSVTFRFKRVNFSWKITKIGVDGDYFPFDDEARQEIEQMILGQLAAIKSGDTVDAYYTYLSRDFQNKTPLGSFQEMIEFFTPVKKFEKVEITGDEPDMRKASLHADGRVADLLIHLVNEGGNWKVSALEFGPQAELLPADPEEVIQSQLGSIRAHEFAKAYFDFTSKEFQQSITLHDFKSFLKKQDPFFNHRTSKIHAVKQAKNEALIAATLCAVEDDRPLRLEFELVLEDNRWKVNHILMN